jgi:hypothetical protein
VAFRLRLAQEVLRTLPGGSTMASLLKGSRRELGGGAGILEEAVSDLLARWNAPEPAWITALASFPSAKSRGRMGLFAWSAYEVADMLQKRHPQRKRVVEDVANVLAAGGWKDELGDPDNWIERTTKAITGETRRRARQPRRFFERG